MAKRKQTHIVYRDLLCKLSDAEKAAISDDMAKAELGIEKLKGEVKELNVQKRTLQGHLNTLAHNVEDGTQEKSVECHWVEDLPKNVKRLIRQDTKKVVDEVALTAEELNESLPGMGGDKVTPIDKGKGKKGKGGKTSKPKPKK